MIENRDKIVNVPNLRFPGFNEGWEVKKLGEVATNKSKKYNPKSKNTFIKCIELEHLAGETGQLLGFTDGSQSGSIKNVFQKNDVLFGKLRPYLKKYHQPNFDGVCSSEIWVLNGNDISNNFLYYLIQTNKFIDLANQSSGSKMPRADWNIVENGIFSIPTCDEQKKLAAFLSLLDERIQTQSKIIQRLESLMQGVREKVFKQQKRFKNKKGHDFPEWEAKKLDLILIKNSNKNKGQKHTLVQSVSNKYGFINQDEMFEDRQVASKNTSNYYVIEKGHFAYNPSRIDVGSLAYKFDNETSVISPLYISFLANNNYIKDDYLLNWFSTQQFLKQMNKSFEGSVRNTLSYESLVKMKISIPSLDEQDIIINFLSSIDQKIKTENVILEQFKSQKKYLLNQMFV